MVAPLAEPLPDVVLPDVAPLVEPLPDVALPDAALPPPLPHPKRRTSAAKTRSLVVPTPIGRSYPVARGRVTP